MEEDVYASLGAYNDSGGDDWSSSEHLVLWEEDEAQRPAANATSRHNQLQVARWNATGNATISATFEDVPFDANNYWALLALVLVLGTAAGNILVCLAIAWERRLQNVTNYFLMSLAITDLMVAVLVMPLGILTLVKGESFVPFNVRNRVEEYNNQSQRQKRGKDIRARTFCDVANTRHELHLMKLLVGMALAVCRLHYVSDISIKAGKHVATLMTVLFVRFGSHYKHKHKHEHGHQYKQKGRRTHTWINPWQSGQCSKKEDQQMAACYIKCEKYCSGSYRSSCCSSCTGTRPPTGGKKGRNRDLPAVKGFAEGPATEVEISSEQQALDPKD
ncbi:GM23743 [Drosophila sechellia]|uniref:GM23743 n=1 Tax=Drosophila sechellia TaxID=7238 RepID=B4HLI5_DROSE|nr:GM23743 [Drosophila sechellia]